MQFQPDHSTIRELRLVKKWPSPREPDKNSVKIMWGAAKKTMQGT
jgi:hypothetical protein